MDHLGQILDNRFRLLQLLGEGGMGSVYLGQHTVIGRDVAVKFLRAELAQDEEMIKRFFREAQAAAAIKHKSIIDVFDVGVAPWGEPYLVMEYLEGESLSAVLQRTGPIDVGAVCAIMESVLSALGAAHDKGIVHRDIKPENIFIVQVPDGPPMIKLIDFGISKFTQGVDQTKLTRTGELLGTPTYMAPEQARGTSDIKMSADLYALGIVLYEMLTGELPFTGENYNAIIVNILTTEARPPREAYPDFPIEAEGIVLRAIHKDPEYRYQSAQEMLDALKTLRQFSQRAEQLAKITGEATNMTFAAGDLGKTILKNKGIDVASDVFAKAIQSSIPSGRTQSAITNNTFNQGIVLGLASVAVAIVVAAVVYLVSGSKKETRIPAPAIEAKIEPPVAAQTKDVQISVQGVPQGARIFFKGAPVDENPFRSERSKRPALLKVEAPGFESFEISLVPSEDMTIEARLTAVIQPAPPAPEVKKSRSKQGHGTPGIQKADETIDDQSLKQGKRGTEFTEDFE
ncbi:MAG: serine/threonine-protein kinase [Myxococcota bacterium]|nr:serine/threonine-protein kinase [Myxococcota bacterium]